MTVDEINIIIKAQTEGFKTELRRTQEQLSNLSRQAQSSTATTALGFNKATVGAMALGGVISRVVVGAFKALAQFGGQAIKRMDAVNDFPRMMANMNVPAAESKRAISLLQDKLANLPTALEDATASVARFTSKNGNVAQSTQYFLALNNAIIAGNAPAQQQASAIEQISQAYAKGRPDMMEWRTVMSAMPAQMTQVAKAMNFADASQLGEALRTGKVSMNEFMNTMVRLNREGAGGFRSFEDQVLATTGGVAASVQLLKNAVTRAMAEITNAIGQSNIAGFIRNIARAVNQAVPYLIAITNYAVMAINAISKLFGGKTVKAGGEAGKQAGATAGAIGNLADQAGGAGGAMDKAGGSAKKLKKELAGLASFDEMNVLKAPEKSGGGGGSAGGGGASGGLSEGADEVGKLNEMTLKVQDAMRKLGEFMKSIFGNVDFKKIGEAFKRFKDDVVKAIKPVGQVLGDLWNKYLKPLVTWTANDLLPAFLNALGGALRFVGEVGKAVYSGFIKPFMDYFIAPIARFTGGVLVSFLNMMGDALRKISENRGLVEFLAGMTTGITAFTVALKGITALATFNAGVKTLQTLLISQPQLIGAVVSKLGTFKAAFVLAGGGLAGLKAGIIGLAGAIKTKLLAAFSAVMAHPILLAIGGIAAGVVFLGGSIKKAFEQSAPSEWAAEARAKMLGEAHNKLKEAVEKTKNTEIELHNARLAQADAELQKLEATKEQEKAQREYAAAVQSTGINFEQAKAAVEANTGAYSALSPEVQKVYEAGLRQNRANEMLKISQDNYNQSVSDAKAKSEELKKAKDVENTQAVATQIALGITEGKYKDIKTAIEDLTKTGVEYKDSNGNVVKVTGDDVRRLSNDISTETNKMTKSYRDSMSGADQGFFGPMAKSLSWVGDETSKFLTNAGTKLSEFKDKAVEFGAKAWEGVKGAFSNAHQAFTNIGSNIWNGFKSGIGDIAGKMKSMFSGAVGSVKKFLGIHSPSRLFMGIGGFTGEGFVIGLDKQMAYASEVAKTNTADLVGAINTEMAKLPTAGLDYQTGHIGGLTSQAAIGAQSTALASAIANMSEPKQPLALTVQIGDDKVFDGIIDTIKQRNQLENRTVVI